MLKLEAGMAWPRASSILVSLEDIMAERLEVRSNITYDDVVAFNRYLLFHTRTYVGGRLALRLVFGVVFGSILGMLAWEPLSSTVALLLHPAAVPKELLGLLFLLVVAGIGWFVPEPLLLWDVKRRLRKQLSSGPSGLGNRSLVIEPEGVRVHHQGTEFHTHWTAVGDVEEDVDHVYLCLGPDRGFIIPKRDLGDAGGASAFLSLARSYWSQSPHEAVSVHSKPRRCASCGAPVITEQFCSNCTVILGRAPAQAALPGTPLAPPAASERRNRAFLIMVAVVAALAAFASAFPPRR